MHFTLTAIDRAVPNRFKLNSWSHMVMVFCTAPNTGYCTSQSYQLSVHFLPN